MRLYEYTSGCMAVEANGCCLSPVRLVRARGQGLLIGNEADSQPLSSETQRPYPGGDIDTSGLRGDGGRLS